MEPAAREAKPPNRRQALTIQIGKFKRTEWRAGALLGVIGGRIAEAITK
jgi:hypothetical protein